LLVQATFAISMTLSSPDEYTIAFGGVAIGSTNAKLVESAVGTRSKSGL